MNRPEQGSPDGESPLRQSGPTVKMHEVETLASLGSDTHQMLHFGNAVRRKIDKRNQ